MRRESFVFALLAPFILAPAARAETAPFLFSGPLPSLLAPGATAGVSTSGLPFEIRLSAGGQTIEGGPFDLAPPGAAKSFRLTLSGAAFAAGKLSAKAAIANGTGAALEGLRLDLVQATETFTRKDAQGKAVTETRPQKVVAAPLHFGDLGDGESSDALALEATGLAFGSETTQIVVRGVVSGLRYEKTLHNPTACSSGEIDVDPEGNLYLADTCGNRIAKVTPGDVASTAVELPDQTKGSARDAKTGRLAATYTNYPEIRLIGADKSVLATIGEAQGLDTYPGFLRFDAQGTLWAEAGASIARIGADHKLDLRLRTIAGTDLDSGLFFDLAPDGTLWVVSSGALWHGGADGKKGARVAGPGVRPGELAAPRAPRVAPDGSVWVVEAADSNLGSADRVSVFDREGHLLRVFGRGARAPLPAYPDAYHEAQLYAGLDLAFGPEDRVYIAAQRPGENGECVMVFRRF